MSPALSDYVRYTWQMLTGFRVNHERRLAAMRERDIAPYLDTGRRLQILDLANGRLRPQYILLMADGHRVYGVDRINRPPSNWADTGYRVARWLYIRHVRSHARFATCQTLMCGDVNDLPFADNTFDLVTSVAAFEHFLNVPTVVAEMQRAMRPGGVAWICIHLFTSPSGGHNLSLTEIPLRTIPAGVDAWDHLRKRRLPFHVPLNKWRRDQYVEAFAHHFTILKHYCAMREGEALLTTQIESELWMYSRDELTCGAYVIVARKTV